MSDAPQTSAHSSLPVSQVGKAFASFKQTSFFGSLDGLRALSILAVIWYHCVPWDHGSLLGQGNKGVTLFFAISGFLIVTLLLRAKERTATFSLPLFWGRRMFRIFPLYYAVLAAYALLVWKFESDPAARDTFFANLPYFASFTTNWFIDLENSRVIFYLAWSLAAEEQFYLVWPWIERYARGRWPLGIAIALLIATQVAVWLLGPLARTDLGWRIATSVPAAILLGVCLAHLLHRRTTYRVVWRIAGRRGSAFAAVGLTLLALAFAPAWGDAGELLIALSFAVLVASCVVREDNDLALLLRLRPLAWIGTISYGMYLMHMIAVNIVRTAAGKLGLESPYLDFVGGTLLVVAIASLSYVTYERFFLNLKDRWLTSKRVPRRSAALPSRPALVNRSAVSVG